MLLWRLTGYPLYSRFVHQTFVTLKGVCYGATLFINKSQGSQSGNAAPIPGAVN